MASSYNNPEDFIAWFITGDHLAIVTTDGSDNDTIHQRLGDYKPINEAVTNGVLIHYSGEPDAVTAIGITPDIDNSMHSSSAVAMSMAVSHEGIWKESTRKYGMKKRDKTGSPRRIMPADLR